ncbi:GDSL esterase/lipase [Zea mays]|uniref:GDSL esterase/lipase n=1 Tax=Zea mays TaxID=4577 RepID=A0A3L6G3C0_MAIZE|nr:GDSL esterase/lipase [Zea mays]
MGARPRSRSALPRLSFLPRRRHRPRLICLLPDAAEVVAAAPPAHCTAPEPPSCISEFGSEAPRDSQSSALDLTVEVVGPLDQRASRCRAADSPTRAKDPDMRSRLMLFGDSITELSFTSGGWGTALTDRFARQADVVLRGLSGYNTRWALKVLPRAMEGAAGVGVDPAAVTVFFGANDASLPDQVQAHQHVPLKEYQSNLRAICAYFKAGIEGCNYSRKFSHRGDTYRKTVTFWWDIKGSRSADICDTFDMIKEPGELIVSPKFLQKSDVSPGVAEGKACAAADLSSLIASKEAGSQNDINNDRPKTSLCHADSMKIKVSDELPVKQWTYCDHMSDLHSSFTSANNDTTKEMNEVLFKSLPPDTSALDLLASSDLLSQQKIDLIGKERLGVRKTRLRLKEQILTMKFKAYRHLWKEDVRLLSAKKQRLKSNKRIDQNNRTSQIGSQRQCFSNRSRLAMPGRRRSAALDVGEVQDTGESVLLDVRERGVPLHVSLGVGGVEVVLGLEGEVPVHDVGAAEHLGGGGRVGGGLDDDSNDGFTSRLCVLDLTCSSHDIYKP